MAATAANKFDTLAEAKSHAEATSKKRKKQSYTVEIEGRDPFYVVATSLNKARAYAFATLAGVKVFQSEHGERKAPTRKSVVDMIPSMDQEQLAQIRKALAALDGENATASAEVLNEHQEALANPTPKKKRGKS